ncbi:MAG: APC family permease [Actinomycetota bacterium]
MGGIEPEQRRGIGTLALLKRVLLGRPISTHRELHHRLPKRIALAVFSSDALSSSAYATDEILLVLALAGSGALGVSIPIAVGVVMTMAIVVTSYRQTARAYPQGGGAYIVTKENLGRPPGLIAASSLLIDYVLTVAVSAAAGIAAIGAAFPAARQHRVGLAVVVVALITLANLRGLKESGMIFALPTYGFIAAMAIMIVSGVVQWAAGTQRPFPPPHIEPHQALVLFLILRAFASGSTALTGIEAMVDGVPAFKPPESQNAARTLLALGIILAFLFLGMTFLAHAYRVDPALIEHGRTVPSQIAEGVFGRGSPLFYVVQFFTALILFLAANTSYADFPRLASIIARDRYLPSVFRHRGDKLAFSNGIVILAVAAAGVLVHYRADVHDIIPLYVVGVFTSFTLSQTGMVLRWRRLRTPRWRRSATINGIGAVTTGIVLVIVAGTKFTLGAWQVVVLIPTLGYLLHRIRRHYLRIHEQLEPAGPLGRVDVNKVVVLTSPYPGATLKALGFARAFGPRELHVLGFRLPERRLRAIRRRWREIGLKLPIEATGPRIADLLEYLRDLDPTETDPVMVVIPDPQDPSPLRQLLRTQLLLRIKRALLFEPHVVVASVPFRPDVEAQALRLRAPTRLSIIVLVSAVHRATLRAVEYARSLQPAELKALTISTDPGEGTEVSDAWERAGIDVPLEVVDSPYRSLIQTLLAEVRALRPNPDDAVAVVVPEFVVPLWQQLLHNQTALLIKATLLFEPNVVVINVPYRIAGLRRRRGMEAATAGERGQ